MGRPRSPDGYKVSRLNALRHGVMSSGLLKSRGPERCPMRRSCHVPHDQELAPACRPGADCPVEKAIRDAYIEDARSTFSFCLAWLSDHEFEQTIAEMALAALQRQRLSAIVARDGFTRPKIHPISGLTYGLEESLAAGRYATALDHKFNALTGRIIHPPDDAPSLSASA